MPKYFRTYSIILPILVLIVAPCLLLTSCQKEHTNILDRVLHSEHSAIKEVMQKPEEYELQIIFTEIEQNSEGEVYFKDHDYLLNNEQYFYPASTVKLPAAILALENLQSYADIDAHTTYTITRDTLTHTIADDIKQIFAVSDNEAYNRLYEFMGRDLMNKKLIDKGIFPVRFSHRLSTTDAANEEHLALSFHLENDSIQLAGQHASTITPLTMKGIKKGKGYMKADSLISGAMDFSEKNYFPLIAQHELMKRLFFEEHYTKNDRFILSEENKKLLQREMHTVPRKNGYDESTYYDGYGKFFIYGDTKDRIPEHIKIYNKVGYAYGTLTETAYILDTKHKLEFLLSATILVNKNGIFNDDTYEFESIGIPFLAQLGRELYQEKLKQLE